MPVQNDDGSFCIIQYTGDASAESTRNALKIQIMTYLLSNAKTSVQIDAYERWTKDYKYNIDCDALKVLPEDIVSYGISPTGILG